MWTDYDDGVSWQEPDFILSYLISTLVNMGGAPVGITLLVNGTIISGTLIGEREYLARVSESLQTQIRNALEMLSPEDRHMAEAAFDLRDLVEDIYPEDADEDDEEPMMGITPLVHLHLQDPIVLSSQPAVQFRSGPVPVMRIRLAQVDGWMLGAATAPDDEDSGPSLNGYH